MGFFDKMKAAFNNAMADFTGENEEAYEALEEMLILSDAGMDTTEDIMEKLRCRVREEGCRGEEQLRKMLASILTETMDAGDNSPPALRQKGNPFFSARATRSAPPLPSSLPCGQSAPDAILCVTRKGAIPPPLCLTRSQRQRRAAAT